MIRTIRRLLAVAVVGTAAVACAPAPNADIGCAWPVIANRDVLNVAYPDAGATYFATQYRLVPGQRLELRASFPFARYTSFVTYGVNGSAVDSLADIDIASDPGSDNPFTNPGASGDPALRRYTITVDPNAAPGGAGNVIAPLASPGTMAIGTIIQRIYVPDDAADVRAGVPLPSIVVRNADGSSLNVPACLTQSPDPALVGFVNAFGPATDQPALDPPFVARPLGVGGLYANPDNTYVAAVVAHQPGRVVVVRALAPTFPNTRAGDPPTQASQLRYWSMCMNEYRKPYPVTGCAADDETALDSGGAYTFVISTPADRPTNATVANGVTWLDWGSTSVNGVLIMRHMLPDPSFTQSALGVAPGAAASTTMGPYAPVARYCSKTTFESGGTAAGGAAACGL